MPAYPAPTAVETSYDAYQSMSVARFTLADALPADRLVLELDGGPDGIKDFLGNRLDGNRDGVPGGDYQTRLTVLPGDASNVKDYIDAWDVFSVRQALNTSTTRRGTGPQLDFCHSRGRRDERR